MKKRITIFLFVLLFPTLIGSYFLITTKNDEPEIYREIKKTAKDGLQDFVKLIPENFETSYGFNSKYEAVNSEIGNVYEVYTISPEFLNFPKSNINSFAKPVEQFRVEVTFNEEVKTFLTVIKENGNYKVVDLGGAELAKEFSKTIVKANDNNPRRIILRLYQLQCDILATSSNSENFRTGGNEIECFSFYSTFSSRKTFPSVNEYTKKYSFGEFMPYISEKYSQKFNEGGVK